jgi:hypothetical protein
MIRTAFKSAAAMAGFVLLASSVLHADSFGPSTIVDTGHLVIRDDVRHRTDQPAGPDLRSGPQSLRGGGGRRRRVAPTGGPGCPVDINIYSPYTAGYSGR